MKTYPWLEYFNVNVNDLKASTTDAHPSLLYLALEKKTLNASEYYQWARNYYKIPIIHDDFFTENTPQAQLLTKYNFFNWNPECYPIAEWENNIYVACLEPQEDLLNNPRVQFVITPIEHILSFWEKLISNTPIPIERAKANVINGGNELKDVCENVFTSMKEYFEKSIVFLVKKQDLYPWMADCQSSSETHPISLTERSIFSIVHKTKRPFHGIVFNNPTNQKFFDEWNYGQKPEHVTIVPIDFHNGRVAGMLLGFGNKNIPQLQSLNHAEAQAKKLSEAINAKAENAEKKSA